MSTKKLSRHNQAELAIHMILHGYQSHVIQECTGLTDSMVRDSRRELERSGKVSSLTAGKLKSAPRIVDTRRSIASASLLMSCYLALADRPEETVDIHALSNAYEVYTDVDSAPGLPATSRITINEAYVLARDYANGKGRGELQMKTCGCGADYLVVADQRVAASCPLCSLRRSTASTYAPSYDGEEGRMAG